MKASSLLSVLLFFFRALAAAALALATSLHAAPPSPARVWVSAVPLTASSPFVLAGRVQLEWPASPGATGYNVKRATSANGSFASIGSPAAASFLDTTAVPGTVYHYRVTAVDATGESEPSPVITTMPAIAVDNLDTANVTLTGTWSSSTSVPGYYGTNNLFDLTTSGKSVRFQPSLPVSGRYDVYLRWTSHSNRSTSTSVEVADAVGTNTFKVNQQLNGGTWFKLRSFDFLAGNTGGVTILNAGANGTVVADAVLFVLNDQPLPAFAGYTRTMFEENFDGAAYDPEKWTVYDPYRPNVSVADGLLKLTTTGDPAIVGTATSQNWLEGSLRTTEFNQRFGYFEAVIQLGRADGLNNAVWLNTPDSEFNSQDGPEIDLCEAHHYGKTYVAVHNWRPERRFTSSNLDVANIYPGFHTTALEWRTDGTMVWYWDGQVVQTVPASKTAEYRLMSPVQLVLSTKVIPWAHSGGDNGIIDGPLMNGSSMHVAYFRTWMKPGWTGATDSQWTTSSNWGPDGIPGPGDAAVFNGAAGNSSLSIESDTSVKEIYFASPDCPALTISGQVNGTARLLLGSLDSTGDGMGGIIVNRDVTAPQTVTAPILAQRDLTFSNYNPDGNVTLDINGPIMAAAAGRSLLIAGNGRVNIRGDISSDFGDMLKVSGGSAWLYGNNSFTGNITIENGKAVAAHPSALGGASGVVEVQNYSRNEIYFSGTLGLAEGVRYPATKTVRIAGRGDATGTGAIEVADNSVVSFAGPLVMAASAQIGSGTGTGTLTIDGPVDTTSGAFTLTFSGRGTTIMSGDITGAGSLVKNDVGTVRLHGSVAVSGGATVNEGTLVTSLGAFTAPIVNWGTVVFDETADTSSTGNWGGSSGLYLKQGGGTLTVPNTISTTGTLSIQGGAVRLGASNRFSDSLTLSVETGGTFDLNASTETIGKLVLNGGSVVNSTGTSSQFLAAASYDFREGTAAARLGGAATVVKTTPGTVTLAGANSFTGGTTVQDGTLELAGSLASPLVVNGGTLGLGSTTSIRTISGNLTINAGGKLRVRINGPTAGTQHDQLGITGSLALGGDLEVSAAPGLVFGTTFRVINCTSAAATVTGIFSGKPANKSFRSGGYHWLISYAGGTGNDIVLTAVSPQQAWRYDYFGTTSNAGSAADTFDFNGDGETNFYEFATGQDPGASSLVPPTLARAGSTLAFTYTRANAALTDGTVFSVEWSSSLVAGTWNSTGVSLEILGDNGILQTVRATLPIEPGPAKFMRLRVTKP